MRNRSRCLSHFSSESAPFNVGVSIQPYAPRVSFDSQKSSIICKYCKKPSHSIEKLYKLHGFPQCFKFTKNPGARKASTHMAVNSSSSQQCPSDSTTRVGPLNCSKQSVGVPDLIKAQYSQLIHLPQQTHVNGEVGPCR